MAQGGYSTTIRTNDRFVFAIPEELASEDAAPMLCAGLTVYSPMVRNNVGPGKKIGIVGIGGLGRMSLICIKTQVELTFRLRHHVRQGPRSRGCRFLPLSQQEGRLYEARCRRVRYHRL